MRDKGRHRGVGGRAIASDHLQPRPSPVEVAEASLGDFAFFWGGLLVEILLRGAVARCPGTLRAGRPGALRAACSLRNTLTGRTHGARGSPRASRRRRPRWGGVIRPGSGHLGAARRRGLRSGRREAVERALSAGIQDYTMRYPWASPARSCYPFWGSRGARGRRGLAPFFVMTCSFWRAMESFLALSARKFQKLDLGL